MTQPQPRRTRAQAYADWQGSAKALHHLRQSGAPAADIAAETQRADAAYAEYLAWKEADSVAAQAGAFDHLEANPAFNNPDY